MPTELYLYTGIYSWTTERLLADLNESMDEEVTLRVNTPGGSVFDGYGILAKIKEHGNVTAVVDGMAASMGAYILPYAKKIVAYDMARIMIHRADAYTGNDEQQKKLLVDINKDLRAKIERAVDAKTFEKVTGYSFDDVFNPETRLDVWLNAKQAKKIGLVDEVRTMTPDVEANIQMNFAASLAPIDHNNPPVTPPVVAKKSNSNSKSNKMTKDELKASHPEVYNSIVAEAQEQEQDRVQAWLTYMDVDAKTVKEGIESKKAPSLSQQTELNRKAIANATVANLEKGNSPELPNASTAADDGKKPTEADAVEAEMNGLLNLNAKK